MCISTLMDLGEIENLLLNYLKETKLSDENQLFKEFTQISNVLMNKRMMKYLCCRIDGLLIETKSVIKRSYLRLADILVNNEVCLSE